MDAVRGDDTGFNTRADGRFLNIIVRAARAIYAQRQLAGIFDDGFIFKKRYFLACSRSLMADGL